MDFYLTTSASTFPYFQINLLTIGSGQNIPYVNRFETKLVVQHVCYINFTSKTIMVRNKQLKLALFYTSTCLSVVQNYTFTN